MSLSALSLSASSRPDKQIPPTVTMAARVFALPTLTPYAKLVALALAERMAHFRMADGRTVTATWAGQQALARDCGIPKRAVMRAERELVTAGILTKLHRAGPLVLVRERDTTRFIVKGRAVVFALDVPMARVVSLRPGRWRGVQDDPLAVEVAGQDWACPHPVHCTSRAGCARKTALDDGKRAARFAAIRAG